MQAADCFVCPSTWAEAAGLVNLEATSSGLPVIASRIGGIPEYIEEGRSGFLFSPGDHRELARHILFLHQDSVFCKEMSARAREHALNNFTTNAGIQKYLELYQG